MFPLLNLSHKYPSEEKEQLSNMKDWRSEFPNGKSLKLGDDMKILKEKQTQPPQCLKVMEHLEQGHVLQQGKIYYQEKASWQEGKLN